MRKPIVVLAVIGLLSTMLVAPAAAHDGDPLDPAHNLALPCEHLATPGLLPRSAKNIAHVANVCGFVGTDIEFQSRTLADGSVRDYAFVGTMGAGTRIFDITDPAHPFQAGGYFDPGWQNDVQVRGDLLVLGFDPIRVAPTASVCLQSKGASGGVDIVHLHFDRTQGTFETSLSGCVAANPGGGAHNSTIHPGGKYLVMVNPRTHGSVDVVDLRGAAAWFAYRIVQNGSLGNTVCSTPGVSFTCISNGRPGTWSPHDVSFSRDGKTMYVAAIGNDTVIVDVARILEGSVSTVGVVPNDVNGNVAMDGNNITIAHQSDTSADGKILIITDERGGGLQQTQCNTDPSGVIGGAHFWALAPIAGVAGTAAGSPANPIRLGVWFYPNPQLLLDPLQLQVRTERGCTIHVLRPGGNGTAGPGAIASGYGGASSLPLRELVTAHYGAGVWHLDFSRRSTSGDGVAEDGRSTWGNTLGWNVMPGADTWSAKEYKGFIYTGDMARGFDVYSFNSCDDAGCLVLPVNTPGSASGGGRLESEVQILRGTSAGGSARFGFEVDYATGAVVPDGELTFRDSAAGKYVVATAFDSFTAAGSRASFTGRAIVNGSAGVRFFVEVEDLGQSDSFRIVLSDGYGAAGRVTKGNVRVSGGAVLSDGAFAIVPHNLI